MTSPAIKLAKECNVKWHSHISTAVTVYEFYPNDLERFYARAQAQALENTANEFDNHREADGRSIQFANALRRMADNLERS